jgi:hypothetical protein
VFVAYATAMLFSMAIGIPLAKAWGLPGGIWGMNIADGVSLVMSLLLLRRKIAHAELQTVYTTTI